MSGVSVGWFDPRVFHPDPDLFVRAIRRTFAPRLRKQRAWPLAVSSIRLGGKGLGIAYAVVGGHIPVHIDTVGLDDSDGKIFQFVLETANRPLLLTAPFKEETSPIYAGFAPPDADKRVAMAGMELKAGMAVHFDITTTWHAISGMPVPMGSFTEDLAPKAVIIQVSGFQPHQIGDAVDHAARYLARDLYSIGIK